MPCLGFYLCLAMGHSTKNYYLNRAFTIRKTFILLFIPIRNALEKYKASRSWRRIGNLAAEHVASCGKTFSVNNLKAIACFYILFRGFVFLTCSILFYVKLKKLWTSTTLSYKFSQSSTDHNRRPTTFAQISSSIYEWRISIRNRAWKLKALLTSQFYIINFFSKSMTFRTK